MFYIEWIPNGIIGKYKLVYEKEDYLTQEEIEYENKCVGKLKKQIGIYNRISEEINKNGFPNLSPSNYKNPTIEYPCFVFAPSINLGIQEVPVYKIIGSNWANLPKTQAPNYPKPRKVREILKGYLNINEKLKNTADNMKPIPVYKIFDEYFCDEGNHRLYVSRLLKKSTIKAEVVEFDYKNFLLNSNLCHTNFGYYICYKYNDKEEFFDISEIEKDNYIRLLEKYKKSTEIK